MNAGEIMYRMKSLFKNKFLIKEYESVSDAYHGAKNQQNENTLILVYGSFYTVSEALQTNINIIDKVDAV